MSKTFPIIEFKPSELIFEQNAPADYAYILRGGRVEISMRHGEEKLVLAELKPVSVFGEMALLSKERRRTATAMALDHVRVIKIDKDEFDKQLKATPSFIATILYGVTERLIDTSSKLYPGYVERRNGDDDRRKANMPPPGNVERRKTMVMCDHKVGRRFANPFLNHERIKIQNVRSEEKISRQPLNNFREVREVSTTSEGVRVDYFDGGIEWFPINTLVYVLHAR